MNSKLFQLLRTFDKKSLFAFYKWAQIPYFNNNTIIVSYIKAYIPIASKNTINTKDIEKIYKEIYPKNQFNLNHFKQIQTAVYQCALQFVAQIQLHKDAAKKRELGQVYLYENEPKLYAKEWKHLRSKFVVKNEAQYESSFRELDLYNRFTVDEIRKKGRKLNFDSKEVLQELSAFFIISYLRYACQVVNLKNLKTYEEELPWIEQVLVQAKRCKDDYVIQIYLTTYQLVSNPEEQGFYLLKDLLEKFAIHLEKPDAFEVYIYAQNYCIRQFNGGNANYLNELFDLYKETLDKAFTEFSAQ